MLSLPPFIPDDMDDKNVYCLNLIEEEIDSLNQALSLLEMLENGHRARPYLFWCAGCHAENLKILFALYRDRLRSS